MGHQIRTQHIMVTYGQRQLGPTWVLLAPHMGTMLAPRACYQDCHADKHLWGITHFDISVLYISLLRRLQWRHDKGKLSVLLSLCEGKPPINGGFPQKGSVTRSFNVFCNASLNKLLNKQSSCRRSPWRLCEVNDSNVNFYRYRRRSPLY